MSARAIGTRRLLGKFLLVQVPVFVLASLAALSLLSHLFAHEEGAALDARVGSLSARIGALISTPQAAGDMRQAENYLGLLMADTAVMCAELRDAGKAVAMAPRKLGCRGQDGFHQLSLAVAGGSQRRLVVRFSDAELVSVKADKRQLTLLSLVFGLLIAGLASGMAFSLSVGRPVTNLLAAIRRSSESGSAATVMSAPADELGTVITAFNDMQERLGEAARRNLQALQRLEHIYKETPGLMFSMSSSGHFTSVSGYWLEKTGYDRDAVLGRPLTEFLCKVDGEPSVDLASHFGADIRDLPLVIRTRDGEWLEVLLSATLEPDPTGAQNDYLCVMSDVTRLNAVSRELRRQALTDNLTGLANRLGFNNYLERLRALPPEELRGLTILFVDLDNFKWVNDSHGHEAGDALLRMAAGRMQACLAAGDMIARFGGDEFAVVLCHPESTSDASAVADRILAAVNKPFHIWQITAHVGCSIGVAGPLGDGSSIDDLLRLADLAMYKSKQDGRNRVNIYSAELGARVGSRDRNVSSVRNALEQNRLKLFYQPIVELNGLKPSGAEALLRVDAGNNSMSPAEFISIAEESGLIGQVGDFVLHTGLKTGERLISRGGGGLNYISINLSPRQLDAAFMSNLLERLRKDPVLARHITFEITETALINHEERISAFFAEARSLGARIALDDFGTGYSSLSHITRYPVDFVKLDRSFIRNIDSSALASSRRNQALVKAAAMLCRELNIQVVAEGIETQAELDLLISYDIAFGQGYLFSKALPEHAFTDWIDVFNRPSRRAGDGSSTQPPRVIAAAS